MKKIILILVAFSAVAASIEAQDNAVILELKGSTMVVAGTSAKLKDIADVSVLCGEGQDSRVLQYRVESVEVCRFQQGCMEATIDHGHIKLALKRIGLTDVSIAGSKELKLVRKSKILDNRRLLDMAREHVRSALAGIDENAKVDFLRRVDPVRIPAGRYSMDVRFAADPKNKDYIGVTELRLVAEIDGVVEELAQVPLRITRQIAMIRLKRNVRRGDAISREDIAFETGEVTQVGGQLFYRIEEPLGLVAVRDLKSGQDLMRSDLKQVPVVYKEDLVNVRVKNGKVQVETICVALQDGAPGDRIKFKNISSERTIEAIVVDRRSAEIVITH